jgi:hypothetical protein
VKDYLLMEEEFVAGQERLKPQEDKNEEDRSKVDDLRGSPMSVGNSKEIIDENHAIVSSPMGPEYYVNVLSFMDKDQLEPCCVILMHNKVLFSFYLVHIAFEKEQWCLHARFCLYLSVVATVLAPVHMTGNLSAWALWNPVYLVL